MDILEERYHRGSLIVTSQVELQGWLKLFEEPLGLTKPLSAG